MRNLRPTQYGARRPEEISFKGVDVSPEAGAGEGVVASNRKRSEEASVHQQAQQGVGVYLVEKPRLRRKVRHPFNFFEDQIDALKKIQIAETANGRRPHLADLAQEAFDDYIARKVKELSSLSLRPDSSTEGERSKAEP